MAARFVRFDERPVGRYIQPVTTDEAIERIQFAYPQIYYACHTRHGRRQTTSARVSASDAQLLVHLDRRDGTRVSELASHMGLSRSTVSEAVSRLSGMGYVTKTREGERDGRLVRLRLTPAGVAAVRAVSVLEARRLRRVLGALSLGDVKRAVAGLAMLAEACRRGAQRKGIDRSQGVR
jgi:DNA-binding MarR family transcriptional regulator